MKRAKDAKTSQPLQRDNRKERTGVSRASLLKGHFVASVQRQDTACHGRSGCVLCQVSKWWGQRVPGC